MVLSIHVRLIRIIIYLRRAGSQAIRMALYGLLSGYHSGRYGSLASIRDLCGVAIVQRSPYSETPQVLDFRYRASSFHYCDMVG